MGNMQTESLFEKLVNWKLSEAEIEKLADLFREKTPSDEVDRYFLRMWDKCRKYNADLQSEALLNKIQQRLNNGHPDISPVLLK